MKQKFMRRPKERGYEFAIRIMKGATTIGGNLEHLTARQVHRLVDQRGSRKMNLSQVQSSLYYAAKKTGKITIHKVKGKRKTYTYNHALGGMFGKMREVYEKEGLINVKVGKDYEHNFTKDAIDDFNSNFTKHDMKEPRDALVSTVKHEFTAEQLLESLENLNQDLHDNVIVAIFAALGKDNYSPLHHDFTKPQPRKTALMDWHFEHGNLVVKE
tara:strand:+ start:321 stop:962 length:642 start_codon:yes stop_codon:yes gene_type:complete